MADFDELKALCERATPGPWEQTGSSVCNWHDGTYELEVQVFRQEDGLAQVRADAAFIAAANPATVLALLSANREMREALRPFSALADMVGESWTDETPAFVGADGVTITIGQLRKARSALTTQRGDGDSQ